MYFGLLRFFFKIFFGRTSLDKMTVLGCFRGIILFESCCRRYHIISYGSVLICLEMGGFGSVHRCGENTEKG